MDGPGQLRDIHHSNSYMPVCGRIDAIRCAEQGVAITDGAAFGQLPAAMIGSEEFKLKIQQGFHNTDFHQRSPARLLPADEGSQYTLHQLGPAQAIRY